ncbi:hypothetical protein HRbin39_01092 [bacterium HR39]|nr:hypothetical protein HRbin39_01092 [bacterium HR39]
MTDAKEEGFLARWARRKREAARERREEPERHGSGQVPAGVGNAGTASAAGAVAEPDASPDDGREPEDPAGELRRLGLPDPEALGPDADFRVFFTAEVPAWLKRRALRRLIRVNPIVRMVDGLDSDADDFTDAATVTALLESPGRTAEELRRRLRAFVEGGEDRERAAGEASAREPAAEGVGDGASASGADREAGDVRRATVRAVEAGKDGPAV